MPSYKLIYHLDFYLSPSFDKEPILPYGADEENRTPVVSLEG